MPTYEYICANCGHELELFQGIRAPAIQKCPKCGRRKLKRLIGTGSGIIFKGSGFYQTDYRSSDYQKASKKEKSETTDSQKKTKPKEAESGDKSKGPTKAKPA
ncbi:MAG TPA: FmdB family zinc ribbon protein [Sedimentisphaerales bacterium]|nr:FmdB family zinc ribbon protein [Sedimentisphaerales bacterium]